MNKITKKEIREVLSTYRNRISKKYEMPGKLVSYDCGFYIKNGDIYSFVFYKNEGVNEDVYNKRYERIIHLKKYTPCYGTLKDCVDEAYEEVIEWLEEDIPDWIFEQREEMGKIQQIIDYFKEFDYKL